MLPRPFLCSESIPAPASYEPLRFRSNQRNRGNDSYASLIGQLVVEPQAQGKLWIPRHSSGEKAPNLEYPFPPFSSFHSFHSLGRYMKSRLELQGLGGEKGSLARVASWEGEESELFHHQVPLS